MKKMSRLAQKHMEAGCLVSILEMLLDSMNLPLEFMQDEDDRKLYSEAKEQITKLQKKYQDQFAECAEQLGLGPDQLMESDEEE